MTTQSYIQDEIKCELKAGNSCYYSVKCLQHSFKWLRDLDTKKIGTDVFGDLRNVALEENGEDKMVRESN